MTPEQFQLLLILLFNPILNFVLSILSNKISERFHLRIRSAWIWLLSIASCLLLAYVVTLQDAKYQQLRKWIIYLLIFLIFIFLLDCLYLLIFKPKPELPSKITPREELIKLVYTEVNSRLEQSLHNRVYILLEQEKNISQVETPWVIEVKVGNKPKTRLKNTEITTIFDLPDITGRLLILGQPGGGKTTMLLKLAEELVKRALDDPAHPIPVLFSLPTWKKDSQNINDWLIEQLKEKYGVRKDIGSNWIENQEIIPLLDGLDELAAERQEACVKKINDFLHPGSWNSPIVVCSRIEEYGNYTTLLQLNNSIELCPFTIEQVNQYLYSTGNVQLQNQIRDDAKLSKLAKIPFFLNIIVLSAQEVEEEKWQQFKSSDERVNYLFEAYINKMLNRFYQGTKPQEEQTRRWLGWLAQQLTKNYETEFLIEDTTNWLDNENQVRMFLLIRNLFVSLYAIIGLLFFVWFILLNELEILLLNFLDYLGQAGEENPLVAIHLYLAFLLVFLLFDGKFGYGSKSIIRANYRHNLIKKSTVSTELAMFNAFNITICFFLIKQWIGNKNIYLNKVLAFSLFFCIGIVILMILMPFMARFILRLILWSNGYIPWNYAKFLNYATNRLFLQRVGGSYRFVHDLLRQHFAKTYIKPSKN